MTVEPPVMPETVEPPVTVEPTVEPETVEPPVTDEPPVEPDTVEPSVTVEPPVASDAVDMVATVGTEGPAAIVEPPCAAICSLSDFSFSLAVLYLSVAAALRFVCFATAAVAADLAASFFE